MSALTYAFSDDGTCKAYQLGIGGLFTFPEGRETYRILRRVPDRDAYVIKQCSGFSVGTEYEMAGRKTIRIFNGPEG